MQGIIASAPRRGASPSADLVASRGGQWALAEGHRNCGVGVMAGLLRGEGDEDGELELGHGGDVAAFDHEPLHHAPQPGVLRLVVEVGEGELRLAQTRADLAPAGTEWCELGGLLPQVGVSLGILLDGHLPSCPILLQVAPLLSDLPM